MENMSDDLIHFFDDFEYELTLEQRDNLEENRRHKASKRGREIGRYYCSEDWALMYPREKITFDKFGYESYPEIGI